MDEESTVCFWNFSPKKVLELRLLEMTVRYIRMKEITDFLDVRMKEK